MAIKSKWGMNIQREVQDLMRKHNLSREDIASKLGVAMMTVYRWETGKTSPKSRFIIREFEKMKQGLGQK